MSKRIKDNFENYDLYQQQTYNVWNSPYTEDQPVPPSYEHDVSSSSSSTSQEKERPRPRIELHPSNPFSPANPYFSQSNTGRSRLLQVPAAPAPIPPSQPGDSSRPGRSYSPAPPVTNGPPTSTEEIQCDGCGKARPDVWFCNVCACNLCIDCWKMQLPHKMNRLAAGNVPHEKTNVLVAKKVQRVLVPSSDQRQREQLHEEDEETAWFGIDRPDGSAPLFQDYGRYAKLLAKTEEEMFSDLRSPTGRDSRTPSLVSFVGQTGAGKSTIIKLLIDLSSEDDEQYLTPVVGASGVDTPTSEDVHLYSDPSTATSDAPMFFADCEGLQGGEREPLGAKFRRTRRKEKCKEHATHPSSERELAWADSISSSSREFAVTNLYPRLLYTFSDTIVFVLKNPRVIESVFEQLVKWAAAALETSSNQPVLPHAIIALNASENDIPEDLWDVETATTSLLESISRTVFKNDTFKRYAQFWRERKRPIETVEQLMLSYYSSIRVVRIPVQGRPKLIKDQVGKLYRSVESACLHARKKKTHLRMLLDAEELQSYLQCAFDHFALTLERPFDFVVASFSNSPIPLDFGGNILKLAIKIMQNWENQADARMIFQELSYMVASCIMLDSARNKIPGTAAEIFPQYLSHLDAALENFCDKHWPCEYVQRSNGSRCINVRSGHGSKGHQDKNGKIFAGGDYQSEWSFEVLQQEFQCNVYFRLEELLNLLNTKKSKGGKEDSIAAEIHRDDVMAWFYRHVSGGRKTEKYNSHSVCFCCLSEPPEHALPCGHVLCTDCVKTYGERRSKIEIEMQGCPLETTSAQLYQSWRIYLKPESAAVRVLTLDGGGIRGIVELEILQHIQRALGGKLPIQAFFDLIVGTSTGGLIALGLGVRHWPIETCINNFKELCTEAFTRRPGGDVPLVGWFVDNFNHSKFATEPLQDALKTAFSDDQYLFGGRRVEQSGTSSVKVAVTSTIQGGSAVVLANYNRRSDEKLFYQFQRPEGLEAEVKTWEAARATSAAPRVFKPFHHERSKHVYIDGGLYHNNPIRIADQEWKLIWKSELCEHPDIVLSLGTAHNPHNYPVPTKKSSAVRLGVISHGLSLMKIAKDHIDDSLDCEKKWREFVSSIPPNLANRRYIRYNVALMENPPALDDFHSMNKLQENVRQQLANDSFRIQQLAMQLMATSFYFKTSQIQPSADNTAIVTGRLYCRLADGSSSVMELGKLIRDKCFQGRNPYFLIRERDKPKNVQQKDIGPEILGAMITNRKFEFRKLTIPLQNQLSETEILLFLNEGQEYLISGFPRCLIQDGRDKTRMPNTLSMNNHRWVGRTLSQQLTRRKQWTPPDGARCVRRRRTISNYSDKNHVLGHATAEQVQRATELFSKGVPAELEAPVPPKSRVLPEVSEMST